MMVNFNNLVNTAPTSAQGAATGDASTPTNAFAALFAALQPQAQQSDTLASQAQLQQLAASLKTSEHEQLLEQTDLSPEALAQLLTLLQQQQAAQQPELAVTQATTTTQQLTSGATATNQMPLAPLQGATQPADQHAAQTPTQLSVSPMLNAKITETDKQGQPPVFTTPVAPRNPEQTDARVAAAPLVTNLKPTEQITPIETTRPAVAPTMTASVVMVDAPVAQSAQSPQAGAATPSTTAATASIAAPVGSQAWANQLQQNVLQMVMHNQNEMTLRLHPAELGPLQVQLRMDDTTAQLNILTHSQHVRGALEQALPTLREALANQGIQLGDSNVNDQGQQFAQQQARQQAQQWAANSQSNGQNIGDSPLENSQSAENTDMGANSGHTAASHNGQVDTFA